MELNGINIGFTLTGSFCTFRKVIPKIKELKELGANILPIMSFNSYNLDSKFGNAKDFIEEIESITENKIIHTIQGAEPIGPKGLTDIMVVAPCSGNTIAKLANSIRENLQNMIGDLQELNGRHNNPKYPKKTVIELGLSTLKELKNEPDVNGLFDLLIKQKDNLLTWKQEYKLLKSFFNTQVGIFDESLKIYDRVKRNEVYLTTFESEEVAKLNELISKLELIIDSPEPYSMIKDLPILNSDIISIVNNVLEGYKQALGEVISDLAYYLAEEALKQGLDSERYSNLFKINVTDLYERTTDFGELKAIEEKAKLYYEKLLKQISEDSIAKKNLELQQQTGTEEHPDSEPMIQKELVFVNPTNVVQSMQILETEEDVDNYINKLSEELKNKIRNNKRIKLQG